MMKKCGCTCSSVAHILLVVGGLNWGLVGLGYFFGGNWNIVNLLLGNWMWLEAVVYILVGVSAAVKLFGCKCSKCKACEAGMGGSNMGGSMGQQM